MTQRCRGDEGQSSVELALALPVVALVALCVVQAAVVALRHVLVVHAAREAVRAAAVDDTDPAGAAEAGARRASTLDDARLEVRTVVRNDVVEVIVIYRDPTDVVLAGTLVPDVGLRASAVMRREQRVLG